MNFAPIAWIVVVGYLAVSLAIGVFGKPFIGNVAHFLVAGRELGLYIGIATLAATEIGTITCMYNSELGYMYGSGSFAVALICGLVMTISRAFGLHHQTFPRTKIDDRAGVI